MNNDKPDGHLQHLGRSVTPIFVLMDHFLYRFLRLGKKEVWIFCVMQHRIPFFLTLRLFVRWFQMPLGIIYATYPPLQDMTEIV